ncbi:MAG: hypothetical protein E6Q97_11975 [Desulfurellales bacterium]|nr:MAG: hypothetical protein E6Q97_11975 [Desulfurellales bacterium]
MQITPKNKRLSNQVEATEDMSALDAAYDRAADAISAAVKKANPPADMKVLAKYDMASSDPCVPVSTGGSNYAWFYFRADDKRIPLRPASRRGCGSGNRDAVLLDGADAEAHREYERLTAERKKAVATRMRDFKALINGTPSFNALAEVWPAVEAMRERIVGSSTALAVLSDDVVQRIKQDPALMAEAVS